MKDEICYFYFALTCIITKGSTYKVKRQMMMLCENIITMKHGEKKSWYAPKRGNGNFLSNRKVEWPLQLKVSYDSIHRRVESIQEFFNGSFHFRLHHFVEGPKVTHFFTLVDVRDGSEANGVTVILWLAGVGATDAAESLFSDNEGDENSMALFLIIWLGVEFSF